MSAYEEGKKAFEEGLTLSDNPYDSFTLEYNRWFTGFCHASYVGMMYQ